MIRLIENLCAINGVSGDEQDVAAAHHRADQGLL